MEVHVEHGLRGQRGQVGGAKRVEQVGGEGQGPTRGRDVVEVERVLVILRAVEQELEQLGRPREVSEGARSSSFEASGCRGAMISATRSTVAQTQAPSPASIRAIRVRRPNSSVRDDET